MSVVRHCPALRSPASPASVLSTLSLHDALPIWPLAGARRDLELGAAELLHLEVVRRLGAAAHALHAGHVERQVGVAEVHGRQDRKSTRLNSSHLVISYAVFYLKKKTNRRTTKCP